MAESASGKADGSTSGGDKSVCPECGDEFKNEHGMKTHLNQFCRDNPGVPIECSYCGETFRVRESIADSREHCSNECYHNNRGEEYSGEDAPNYQGGKVTIECEVCGSGFDVKVARKGTARFCSRGCMAEVYQETMSGENSPLYSGGHDEYYGPNWVRHRNKARYRDQHRCQDCGATASELSQEPDVHHKKRIDWFKENYDAPEWWEKANGLDNLITLCRSCHMLREPRAELVGQG